MKEKEEKRPLFTAANLVSAIVSFAAFLAIGLTGYYLSAGEFVSAQLAVVYAALALAGAMAVFLRLYRFTLLYYAGCALGWGAGWFIAGLKGDFAPTAGTICTFFIIAVFAVFGMLAQFKSLKKRRERRKEAEAQAAAQAEEARKQAELDAARREREEAEAALTAAVQGETAEMEPVEKPEEEKAPAPVGADAEE